MVGIFAAIVAVSDRLPLQLTGQLLIYLSSKTLAMHPSTLGARQKSWSRPGSVLRYSLRLTVLVYLLELLSRDPKQRPQAALPAASNSSTLPQPAHQKRESAAPQKGHLTLRAAENEVRAAMQARDVPNLQAAVRNLVRLMACSPCNGENMAQVSFILPH